MALVLVNKDGSSNAAIGDIVITGGGAFRKTESGGVELSADEYRLFGLDKLSTGNYNEVKNYYNNRVGSVGRDGNNYGTKINESLNPAPTEDISYNTIADANGIVSMVSGFDPSSYNSVSSGSSWGEAANKIAGYVVVGLVSLVVLERLVDRG